MKHLKRFESASKTIRHREYRQLYKDYFHYMLGSDGFNNVSIRSSDLSEILGEIVGDDVVYDVDYLEKVKQQFKETKEDFDELSQILKDLEEEYSIESIIYTLKPYGKYNNNNTVVSDPIFVTNPRKIITNLDTNDAIFDVYIGLSNEMEGSGLYQAIKGDLFKGISEFINILENKGSKVEMMIFNGTVRKQDGYMMYKSFINLKFNYK